MRILVVGTGALGGYFGARLLAAGRDVTFLVRPKTAELLRQNGLKVVSTYEDDLHLPTPPMVISGDPIGVYDLILLGPKAYDLESTMAAIAGAVGAGTAILPMLNGMAHLAALDARFGAEHVLGGTSFISGIRDSEGTIRHLSKTHGLYFGERAGGHVVGFAAIEGALSGAGFDARLRENIEQDLWDKWMFLASLASLTGLMRGTIGDIVAAGAEGIGLALYAESCSVGQAEGFRSSDEFLAERRRILTQAGSSFSASLLHDVEHGSAIERQQILGDLLERGKRHGLALPLLSVADAHLRCYEARRARMQTQRGVL